MSQTTIEWATHVLNAFTGCDRVSPGCAHCYALDLAEHLQRQEHGRAAKAVREGKPIPTMRYQNDGDSKTSGPGFGFTVHQDKLDRRLSFPAGARVFVNSMSDVFHEAALELAIAQLFARCADRPDVDFLILTKRPERMRELLRSSGFAMQVELERHGGRGLVPPPWPLPNVWLGVSIENRRFVGRADVLRDTPAAVRFISAEPLLGPLVHDTDLGTMCEGDVDPEKYAGDAYTTCFSTGDPHAPQLDLEGIDWLIVGGESGPDHRPIREEWVTDLRDAAASEGTAFFFKQWGGRTPKSGGRELDGRTWDEMPSRPVVA